MNAFTHPTGILIHQTRISAPMFADLSEDILSPAARDTRDDVGGASGGGKPEGNSTSEPDLIGRPTTALLLVRVGVAGTGFEPV
jgi:hypothetical protein